MDNGCDPIEKLLASTGLSCDDLLLRLQQYKTKTQTNNNSDDSNAAQNSSTNDSTTESDPKTVINETKTASVPGELNNVEQDGRHDSVINNDSTQSVGELDDEQIPQPVEEVAQPVDLGDVLKMQLPSLRNNKKKGELNKVEHIGRHDSIISNDSTESIGKLDDEQVPQPVQHSADNLKDALKMQLSSLRNNKKKGELYKVEHSGRHDSVISNYSTASVGKLDDEQVFQPVEQVAQPRDDLGDVLKMQLSSLRNNKKKGELNKVEPGGRHDTMISNDSTDSVGKLDDEPVPQPVEQSHDNLRDVIKMQLSSLRNNKKKGQLYKVENSGRQDSVISNDAAASVEEVPQPVEHSQGNLGDVLKMQLSSLRNNKKKGELYKVELSGRHDSMISNDSTESVGKRDDEQVLQSVEQIVQPVEQPEDNLRDVVKMQLSGLHNNKKKGELNEVEQNGRHDSVINNDSTENVGKLDDEQVPQLVEQSPDNLRDVLKMQLSSLRNNKKKGDSIFANRVKPSSYSYSAKKMCKSLNTSIPMDLDDSHSQTCLDNAIDEEKQQDSSRDSPAAIVTNGSKMALIQVGKLSSLCGDEVPCGSKNISTDFTQSILKKNASTEECLDQESSKDMFSLSEEAQFVILEVTGGVDRLNQPVSDVPDTDQTCNSELRTDNDGNKGADNENPTEVGETKISNYLEAKLTGKKCTESCAETDVKEKTDKSPFVSDQLEDFLNESARLNISYPIPKLGAEDVLNESSKESPYVSSLPTRTPTMRRSSTQPSSKPVKAKTLAEMRRQMQNLTKTEPGTSQETKVKPLKINLSKHQLKKIRTETPDTEVVKSKRLESKSGLKAADVNKTSYLMYKNNKIFVACSAHDKCLGIINKNLKEIRQQKDVVADVPPPKVSNRKRSLLSTLSSTERVKYKPGPLCKKAKLQHEDTVDTWTSEIKRLPRIYLEVQPQFGKPVSSQVRHLLPIFDDTTITQERADFALTALKVAQPSTWMRFKFPVHYRSNQEQILVRKRLKVQPVVTPSSQSSADLNTDVTSVVDGLIKYVEIKEIADGLIKNDDESRSDCNDIGSPSKTNKKVPRSLKRKVELELQRLSCKIINVNDNSQEADECHKSYCRLGCLCKSLQCTSKYSDHCQLVECMFYCHCPPSNKQVTSNNNTLSESTVSHLDDQAKRNLAKIEREFTQTIIDTGNDMILVGSGGRDKVKRTSKVPKKYSDYVETLDSIFDSRPPKVKPCAVQLEKLDLSDIIPFCMDHQLYRCQCSLKATNNKTVPPLIIDMKKLLLNKKRLKVKKHAPNDNEPDPKELTCARIRPIFTHYSRRNKHEFYQTFLHKKLKASSSTDQLTNSPGKETSPQRQHKRKQSFVLKDDPIEVIQDTVLIDVEYDRVKSKTSTEKPPSPVNKEFAIQRRRKSGIGKLKETPPCLPNTYEKVFDGEIKVSLQENPDILRVIGDNFSHLQYLRILPWNVLVGSFHDRTIGIWCASSRPSVLLCNKIDKAPPKSFVDIRRITKGSQIINWIITGRLPGKDTSLMHVVLTPTKNHFLLSGFCQKNIQTDAAQQIEYSSSALTPNLDQPDSEVPPVPVAEPTTATKPQTAVRLPSTKLIKCAHKDMNNETKILILTTNKYRAVLLEEDPANRLITYLPRTSSSARWRMIYLNSDFSYVRFVRAKYSIKYKDLINVVNMASSLKITVILRNPEMSAAFKHPKFGIFCVPTHRDRLFVGPYVLGEDHDTETLRYIHGSLVDTCVFNRMQGTVNTKTTKWMTIQRIELHEEGVAGDSAPVNNASVCIDITQEADDVDVAQEGDVDQNVRTDDAHDYDVEVIAADDEVELIAADDDIEEVADVVPPSRDNLLCLPFVKKLTKEEICSDKVNRYVITNIPHLGYLTAYQQDGTVIDVFWPEFSEGYRFPNGTFAQDSLVQYLSQHFYCVPNNFRINVIIMTSLDLKPNHPMDPKYLLGSENYVCGEFGIYPLRDELVSLKSLQKQREKDNLSRMIRLFGTFFRNFDAQSDVDIIQWATSKIGHLERLERDHKSTKEKLTWSLYYKLRRIENILETMPDKDKKAKLLGDIRKIMNKDITKSPPITETIEIEDSEDDDDEEAPKFKEITQSGPIQTSNGDKSLLKGKLLVVAGKSLLKVNEKPKSCTEPGPSKSPIKISVNKSKIIIKNNTVIISKQQTDSLIKTALSAGDKS